MGFGKRHHSGSRKDTENTPAPAKDASGSERDGKTPDEQLETPATEVQPLLPEKDAGTQRSDVPAPVEPNETSTRPAANSKPAPDALLRAQGIHRWLGEDEAKTHALRGVDLVLEPGNAYSVIGPSGCGKSTLLYLLGLLDRPNEGEIWIAGRRMSTASDEQRTAVRNEHIGFVFQFHFLLPEFTALENVMLPMRKLGRMPAAAMRKRAQSLLEAVGLGKKAHRSTGHLSGGEQQRVAVARSLANEPGIILADEPTGNLDAHNSALIFDLLLRVAHEMQQAVLIVSHNTEMAARCDKVLKMRDGLFESYSA